MAALGDQAFGVAADHRRRLHLPAGMMSAGTILRFGIPRGVIAEGQNFAGNADFPADHGIEVVPTAGSDRVALMDRVIGERPRAVERGYRRRRSLTRAAAGS
ncbi:MAG: hypothetical protein ACE5KF_05060 [Kiloniellaceae bacterium]